MPKQKTAVCRICGKKFTPAWNHPEQRVCYDAACRRKAAAERSARYAGKLKATGSGRRRYAEKERLRYERRKAGCAAVKTREPQAHRRLTLNIVYDEFLQLQCAFRGLLKLLNACPDGKFTYENCRTAGNDEISGEGK